MRRNCLTSPATLTRISCLVLMTILPWPPSLHFWLRKRAMQCLASLGMTPNSHNSFSNAPRWPLTLSFSTTDSTPSYHLKPLCKISSVIFVNDAAAAASHIRVGILTQPCIAGTPWLQSVTELQQTVTSIRASITVSYSDLVRQLRTEMFSSVPLTEDRNAVLVVDELTSNLDELQKEVMRLKFSNTKIIVVAVGKVEEVVLGQLASGPIRDHVLRVDSYSHMQGAKLDVLGLLCHKSSTDIFDLFEAEHPDEYDHENIDRRNGQASIDESEKKRVKNMKIPLTIFFYLGKDYMQRPI